MAQNLTIAGNLYSDVPSLTIPKTGGGNAVFPDTSDATAVAGDIADGKTAYVGGSKVMGTATGGGGFQVALGTFTPAETKALNSLPPVSIEHNAGFTPDVFIFYKATTGTYGMIAISAKADILWGNGESYYHCYVMGRGSSSMGEGELSSFPLTEEVAYIRSSVSTHKLTAGQEYKWIAIGGI